MEDIYKKVVAQALEAVKDVPDADLKKAGFEVVLRQLLQAVAANTTSASGEVTGGKVNVTTKNNPVNKTGLTDDEVNILFEKKDNTLVLRIKPTGKTVPTQQQILAHAILVGYLALFNRDSVSSAEMVVAAKDWKLFDANFSRNIQTPGYIQAKGVKKGVTYSLKPGAISKLKESIQKMARGE